MYICKACKPKDLQPLLECSGTKERIGYPLPKAILDLAIFELRASGRNRCKVCQLNSGSKMIMPCSNSSVHMYIMTIGHNYKVNLFSL